MQVASLGDDYSSKLEFSGNFKEFGSTIIALIIYDYFGRFFPGFLTPMALGLFVAIAPWHAFKNVYTQIDRKLFWACNLFPHFLIWSGASSKEQITIIFGIIVVGFAAKRSFAASRLNIISLAFCFLSLGIIFVIRSNYFVIYFIIFLTSLFAPMLHKTKIIDFQ